LNVAARDIDDYLAALDGSKRSTLQQVRRSIRDVIPDAEECISYGMPAFKVQGKTVAGFAAFKNTSATCHIAARFFGPSPTTSPATSAQQGLCCSPSMNPCSAG
jgi:hypothetical protein